MKLCAFCLEPAQMTGEHLWSAWTERLFSESVSMFNFRTLDSEGTVKRWKGRSVNMKAHVVCGRCNNTWMSDLDADAKLTLKDLIRHAAFVTLLPCGIASMAAFTFKTAVVADHIRHYRGRPFFLYAARKQFARTLAIPNGVQMWCAAFRGKYLLSGRYTTHYAKINTGRFKGFELYIFTYVVGFLVLQLTATRWASIAKRPAFMPVLTQNDTIWRRVSIPFWPSDGTPITWPPLEHFDDQGIEVFAERWGRIAETL